MQTVEADAYDAVVLLGTRGGWDSLLGAKSSKPNPSPAKSPGSRSETKSINNRKRKSDVMGLDDGNVNDEPSGGGTPARTRRSGRISASRQPLG